MRAAGMARILQNLKPRMSLNLILQAVLTPLFDKREGAVNIDRAFDNA